MYQKYHLHVYLQYPCPLQQRLLSLVICKLVQRNNSKSQRGSFSEQVHVLKMLKRNQCLISSLSIELQQFSFHASNKLQRILPSSKACYSYAPIKGFLFYWYCFRNFRWNSLNVTRTVFILSIGGRIVILKWYVPSTSPNPLPGTTHIPVSSNSW